MTWLLPEFIDEVWSVEMSLAGMKKRIISLDPFFKAQLPRFNEVYLSHSYTHLDVNEINLDDYLKTSRFDLKEFTDKKTQITFITREDRFWHTSRAEEFLFMVVVKLKLLNHFKWFFSALQNQRIKKTARLIKKQLGDVIINAIGIGTTGKIGDLIDKRKIKLTQEQEFEWCKTYSQSHIVIGVHGSSMLIPSALAAGFIEILPDYKIRHIAEDTIQKYDNRYSQFLGRHLHGYAYASLVALHAVSMIQHFPYLQRNQNSSD